VRPKPLLAERVLSLRPPSGLYVCRAFVEYVHQSLTQAPPFYGQRRSELRYRHVIGPPGPRSGSPGGGTASSTRRATARRWRACCRGSSVARPGIAVVCSCRGGYHGRFRRKPGEIGILAFVAHVLRAALGILEPETIKQTLESATLACIIPRSPGAGTVHHIAEI
jgi:hypothetical protein